MFNKSAITFPASDPEVTLRGWLYQPQQDKPAYPAIVMMPGFSALIAHGLDAFARVFAEAGFIVLLYDHRHFGENRTNTTVDLEVDPTLQIQDLHAAIAYLQTRADVLTDRIGVWGTSFAGGHAIVAATENPSIKAIVAQVPFLRGHHASLQAQKPEKWQALQQLYLADKEARARGEAPKMTPVVTDDPGKPAIMKQSDAYTFFTSVPEWPNQVTLHSIENSGNYYPMDSIPKLTTPTLFIVADKDTVNPTVIALEAYDNIHAPKSLLMISGEHFAPHTHAFIECSEAALTWFKTYLT